MWRRQRLLNCHGTHLPWGVMAKDERDRWVAVGLGPLVNQVFGAAQEPRARLLLFYPRFARSAVDRASGCSRSHPNVSFGIPGNWPSPPNFLYRKNWDVRGTVGLAVGLGHSSTQHFGCSEVRRAGDCVGWGGHCVSGVIAVQGSVSRAAAIAPTRHAPWQPIPSVMQRIVKFANENLLH